MTSQRIERLRDRLGRHSLDGFLVTNLTNVRYLTGFSGTAGAVLVTGKGALFFTDFRYQTQAGQQVKSAEVRVVRGGLHKAAVTAANRRRLRRVGYEAAHVTVQTHKEMRRQSKGSLRATKGLVEELRVVKDPDEIATVSRAVQVADAAFESVLPLLKPGVTELEISFELERAMKLQGASGVSFELIVASGKRSALPHGVASDKRLAVGDLVTLDLGCLVDGYCSDLTRTVCLGKSTARQRRLYAVVYEAQQRALARLSAGKTGRQIDRLARKAIEDAGWGEHFGHGLGHGVGLQIHEGPRLSKQSGEKLKADMLVTVEPGVYLPNYGGVRLEDLVLVTETGCRILTQAPKPEALPVLEC